MRPGVDVISRDQPPPRSAPTYTGVWFVVGETETGPLEPVEIRSMGRYEDVFGDRAGGPVLYDSVDAYFREGGSVAWVSAIPTTPSTLSLLAVDRGVDAGTQEAPAEPKASKAKASTRAATAPTIETALALFTKAMGPGQVSVPGSSDAAVQAALLQHAADNNRVALIDGLETGDAAAQTALAELLRVNGRYGGLFGPWAVVPGIAAGTERHVPYSAIQAGLIARLDSTGNPNMAAAGTQGRSSFANGLTMIYSDAEYGDLNDAGFDAAKLVYGEVQTYGYRSLADPATPEGTAWQSLGWARLNMAICAQAEVIGERYVFRQIDGRKLTIEQFGSELRAMLLPYWTAGALYGATAEDAFDVDVGSQVNTDETIANGELHAVLRVRMSPFSEWVVIEIVKVATTESVALAA